MKNNLRKQLNILYWILLVISIFITVTGIALNFADFEFEYKIIERIIERLPGFGVIMITVDIYFLIKRRKNPEYAKQEELELKGSDERLIQIRGKAFAASWIITAVILFTVFAVLSLIENEYDLLIGIIAIVHGFSYYIAKACYNRKM